MHVKNQQARSFQQHVNSAKNSALTLRLSRNVLITLELLSVSVQNLTNGGVTPSGRAMLDCSPADLRLWVSRRH